MRRLRLAPASAVYAGAAVVVVALWYGRFVTTTRIGASVSDWGKESYYLDYFRFGLRHGTIPTTFFAYPNGIAALPAPSRSVSYWGNPEVPTLGPWFLLLPFLSVAVFIKVNFLLHVLVGCASTFLLGRRLRLSLVGQLALLILLPVNPWLLQHFAIGYSPWITAEYVPLVVALCLPDALRVRRVAAGAVVDALILYEGGLHVFLWLNGAIATVVAMAVLLGGRWGPVRPAAAVVVGGVLLAVPKLYAIEAAFGGWKRDVQTSYGSLGDLWGLLTDAHTDIYDLPRAFNIYGTNLYDGSFYLGKPLTALIAFAFAGTVVRALRAARGGGRRELTVLAAPAGAAIWVFLGWRGVWPWLAGRAPALAVEIYPWRFLVIPVALGAALAALELDRFARRGPMAAAAAGVFLVCAVAVPLGLRNHFFVAAATEYPYQIQRQVSDVGAFLDDAVTAGADDGAAHASRHGTSGVTIRPAGTRLVLPWLESTHLADFTVRNATPLATRNAAPVALAVDDPAEPVTLSGKTYDRIWLGAGVLVLFAAFLRLISTRSAALTRDYAVVRM